MFYYLDFFFHLRVNILLVTTSPILYLFSYRAVPLFSLSLSFFFPFCAISLSRRHLKSGYVWMRSFGNVEFTNGLAICDFNISSGFTVGLGNGLEKRLLPCHLAHMIRQPCCLKAFVQVQLVLPAIQ